VFDKKKETYKISKYAMSWIKYIQNGKFDRHVVPEKMKGKIAKKLWNNDIFALGMEYGAISMIIIMDGEKYGMEEKISRFGADKTIEK